MSLSIPTRGFPRPSYGWNGDGKSAAEITSDIEQTRYRIEADLRALQAQLEPRRLLSTAAVAAGLAILSLLIGRIRRRKR